MSEAALSVKVEDLSPVKKKLSFDIPWEEVRRELDDAYNLIGKKAKIKGFRPGKTPRRLLEIYFKEQAEDEAIQKLINRFYWDAVEKNSIDPASQPVIDQKGIAPQASYSFTATVEIKPVIEPQGYLDLEVEKEEPKVTDESVQKRLVELQQVYSTLENAPEDRLAEKGDFVTLDFEGKMDGKEIEDARGRNYLLEIGSGRFIPGFEEQIVGMKKGETKEFTVKFPEPYQNGELAGKDVTFTAMVKEIKSKKVPALDESFLKNFEKYDSLEALKDDIRKALEDEEQMRTESEFNRKLTDALLAGNEFEVPQSLVDRQIYLMMANAQRRMAAGGMDPEKAAELSFQMKDRFRDEAARGVKISLLLESIARKESIEAGDDDLEKKLNEIAERSGREVDSIREAYGREGLLESVRSELREQKTLDFVRRRAKIKSV
ncbi:MAG: trigger factor [Syntrophales bacterium]|nr:trigger factor [Syntrophales bacterium]MDD5232534.1 trigger factor [Syntrophales bacterium]